MAHSHSISGRRVSRSHTTATGLAVRIVRMLERSSLITKVSLAVIDARIHAKVIKLTVNFDQRGLRLVAQETSARQELYVSAPDRDALVVYLERWCRENSLDCTIRR